mgnify:CR=1 FL=1
MNYGILSVIPSLLAIVLALLTKNVIIALLASLLAGNLILAGYQPMNALVGLKDAMINVFSDHSSTSIIFILLMLGGLFCLIEKSGGLSGFTTLMVEKGKLIHSKKGAALFTWLVGVLIFIDGTLSVMLTGSVSRPLAKAFRMSPEKNAWIVHSTSTPMSILIPIAAYGPYIASFIEAQGIENPTGQMVSAIGFNFYCILAVAGVALFLLFGIEFGPMKKAEQAYADATGGETTETAQTQASAGGKAPAHSACRNGRCHHRLYPIQRRREHDRRRCRKRPDLWNCQCGGLFNGGSGNKQTAKNRRGHQHLPNRLRQYDLHCSDYGARLYAQRDDQPAWNRRVPFFPADKIYGARRFLRGRVSFYLYHLLFHRNQCRNHRHYDAHPVANGCQLRHPHPPDCRRHCGRGRLWGPHLPHFGHHHYVLLLHRLQRCLPR